MNPCINLQPRIDEKRFQNPPEAGKPHFLCLWWTNAQIRRCPIQGFATILIMEDASRALLEMLTYNKGWPVEPDSR